MPPEPTLHRDPPSPVPPSQPAPELVGALARLLVALVQSGPPPNRQSANGQADAMRTVPPAAPPADPCARRCGTGREAEGGRAPVK